MVLDAFKKYPSQISSAFRRFPVATAFAFFTFFAFVSIYDYWPVLEYILESHPKYTSRACIWLMSYPPAAILISLLTSLVQESLKNRRWQPQAITSGGWLVLSILLLLFLPEESSWKAYYLASTLILIYVTASLSIFIVPFWKDKDENAFWIFLFKNLKALIIGALVATLLCGSVMALVFAFGALFEYGFDDKIFLYIFCFCASFVFPILYFTGIPSIEECHGETPTLSKFATSTIRFLFVPVLALAILLFYAYIVKFVILWDMPQGMVSYFVSGFMVYMLALATILYPASQSTEHAFEKKLLKIFPAACIPLVIMMSVGLIRRFSDYGISTERIYVVGINIFFYAVIAILLIDKIKCKSRYIAITFCAMLFIFTESPFNAERITHHVWMESIKAALVEQGYTKYPLSRDDSRTFIKELRKKDDVNAARTVSRLLELSHAPTDHEIHKHLSLMAYDDAFSEPLTDETCCVDSMDAEPFDSFETSIEYPSMTVLQVPPGTKGAVAIDHYFDDDEFEFTGDTLTFRLSLKEDSGCSCNSDESDACEETPVPVYSFTVDRQTLMQDPVRQIKADKATIAINYLYAEEESKKDKSLRIRGILFTE